MSIDSVYLVYVIRIAVSVCNTRMSPMGDAHEVVGTEQLPNGKDSGQTNMNTVSRPTWRAHVIKTCEGVTQ